MKLMTIEELKSITNGVEDILTPALRKKDEFFKNLTCPTCGSKCMSEVTLEHLTNPSEPVPYGHARCTACRCLFNPDTKLILEVGKQSEAVDTEVALVRPITYAE